MAINSEAQLDRRFMQFVKLLNTYLNHFPKAERHGLAQQIRNAAYEVYGLIVECQKRYQKKTTLTNLDIRHEQLRMFIRLAHELGYFEVRGGAKEARAPEQLAAQRYLALSRQVDELGRMIGGWIAADRANRERP